MKKEMPYFFNIMKPDGDIVEHWRTLGKKLGYPKCCIDSFCNTPIADKQQFEVSEGTGFVPCMKHTKMIKSGKIKLSDLIKNRKEKIPFPKY